MGAGGRHQQAPASGYEAGTEMNESTTEANKSDLQRNVRTMMRLDNHETSLYGSSDDIIRD